MTDDREREEDRELRRELLVESQRTLAAADALLRRIHVLLAAAGQRPHHTGLRHRRGERPCARFPGDTP